MFVCLFFLFPGFFKVKKLLSLCFIFRKGNILETIKAIFTRRSVRSFTKETVQKEDVRTLLKAAMQAPSARNFQPWHFVVISKREILDKIPQVHPYAEMARQAQAGILVCGDLQIEPSVEYNALNCAAATQNILLAAHDLGLGAVWIGIHPREQRKQAMTELFELPETIVPVSLVLLGHPAVKTTPVDRFKEERVHFDKW